MTVIYRLGIDARLASPERAGHCEGQTQKVHMCQNTQTDPNYYTNTRSYTADKVRLTLEDAYTDKKSIFSYLATKKG